MSEKLLSEIKRLYLLPGQQWHKQSADGESYYPAGALTPAILSKSFAGELTVALNLVSEAGLVRALVLDFDGVAHGKGAQHWQALVQLATAMQTELGLPAPAVSVSGRKGWQLWLSLADPLPAGQCLPFLHFLRQAYLADIPKEELDLRPDTGKPTAAAQAVAKLPPCLHKASGKWAAFIPADAGVQYVEAPGLDAAPSMEEQAALLAKVQSISAAAFLHALEALKKKVPLAAHSTLGASPQLAPRFEKAPAGFVAPCVAALVAKGVPHEMQYNTGNLNLAAYCTSAGIAAEKARELAEQMAEASEDHPTSKDKAAKLKNFVSNKGGAFYCDYARNTPAWRNLYGGDFACEACPANPGGLAPDNRPSHEPSGAGLEPAVALDLLAYAWGRGDGLPQIRRVWPMVPVETGEKKLPAPWYELAARALDTGATSAAYFGEVQKHLSGKWIDEMALPVLRDSASAFFETLRGHKATEQAGKAALARAVHLERRAVLSSAARAAIGHGPEVTANVVAMELRGAAEETLRAEAGTGPIQGLRNELFRGLAKRVSEVVPTPFPRLSGLLHGGFRGGRLYVLLAPPKAGKTTLAGVCLDTAAAEGYPCLYVGYEMGREQLVEYAIARRVGLNSRLIETRDLSEEQAERVAGSLDAYLAKEGAFLEMWEAGLTTSLADIAAWVTKAKATHPGKTPLVVIDYLQLANTGIPEIDRHPSETKRVSEVAVACKHLARQTGAAVLALSSVTKSAETDARNLGEIDVTAARDSLAIIHAADGVLALQTQTVKITEGKGENKAETELDPWAFLANQARQQGREHEAVTLERAVQKAEKEYPQGGLGYGIRARLSLLRHRGSTGEVALYYRRAFHAMQEVTLPGLEAVEIAGHDSDISISVFQKYIDEKAAPLYQETFPGFEPPAAEQAEAASIMPEVEYRYVTELAEAKAALAGLSGLVGLDLETTGLSPINAQARLLSVADGSGPALVIDLWKVGGLHALRDELRGLHAVAHNAVFDLGFLWRAGVEMGAECTMLAAHVLTGQREGLKALALRYLDLALDKGEQVSDWSAEALSEKQLRYAALDAVAVRALFPKLAEELAERESERAYTLARDAQAAVVRMELAGMPFDAAKQEALVEGLTEKRGQLLAALGEALEGRNPASGAQLAEWLTVQLGGQDSDKFRAWPKTAKGQLKTGGDDLKKGLVYLPDAAAATIRDALLPFKDVEKKLSAFGASLAQHLNPVTGRIHADFSLAGTVTGRMACSKPNLQQIPREAEFRALFAPPPGRVFVIADYSQMELRVAAQIAGEEALLEAYREGKDTHQLTAAMLLGKAPEAVTKAERQLAKAVNFGLLFGQGAKGLQAYAASSYGVEMSEEQARKYRDAWFKAFPAFKAWHAKSARAAEKALLVRTPAGRERRWESGADFKTTEAYNTPVQGGAAEAILAALGQLGPALAGLDAEPVAVVHDELLVETDPAHAPEVAKRVEAAMVAGMLAIFPDAATAGLVEAKVAGSWADK